MLKSVDTVAGRAKLQNLIPRQLGHKCFWSCIIKLGAELFMDTANMDIGAHTAQTHLCRPSAYRNSNAFIATQKLKERPFVLCELMAAEA